MYNCISVWSLHTCNCFESRSSDFHVHKFDIDVLGIESHWEKLPKLEGAVIKVGWEVEARNRRCEHDNPVTDHSSRFVSIDGIQSICWKYKYNLIWYWKDRLEEKVKNTKKIFFFYGQKHEITFFWRQIQKCIVLTSFTRYSISHSTGLMYLKFPHDISIREDFETMARHSGLNIEK